MPPSSSTPTKVIPAHLNFLAIYNPGLGRSEETERDQIVFYYSPEREKRQQRHGQDAPSEKELREEFDEEMRQVGLAQGIVNFAKSFSDGEDVDSVETEKHRIVVTELEEGWWVLASIALTVLPRQPTGATATDPQGVGSVEYSAREVSPPGLLIQQLIRAHKVFLLHHSPTLTDHFVRLPRERFTNLLGTFWAPFARNWDVLLHGNPAVEVYEGIKLAAGGELGVGVGEEEWGSGEREVLEDLIRHTDGLVDVAVSRFGDAMGSNPQRLGATSSSRHAGDISNGRGWLGCLEHAGPADGILFSGSGALSRHSLHALSAWMEWIYTYGENSYGIRENPTSVRRRRKKPQRTPSPEELTPMPESEPELQRQPGADTTTEHFPDIPPPIITAAEEALENATHSAEAHEGEKPEKTASPDASDGWTSYLTFGYGSSWFGGKGSSHSTKSTSPTRNSDTSHRITKNYASSTKSSLRSALAHDEHPAPTKAELEASRAHFLIGLRGVLSVTPAQADKASSETSSIPDDGHRISVRAVHVEINQGIGTQDDSSTISSDSQGSIAPDMMPEKLSKWKRLRLVIYVNQPFIFALLFEPSTSALTLPSFYHNLHHHLAPLHKPLLASTSATNVALRLQSAFPTPAQSSPNDASTSSSLLTTNPIHALIFSPQALTIHSSLPNIPLPGTLAAEGIPTSPTSATPFATPPWTRIEALNVHSQILASWASTRRRLGEREQSAKTGRGWWVVWMRMEVTEEPAVGRADEGDEADRENGEEGRAKKGESQTIVSYETQRQGNFREAILIRRATDAGGLAGSAGRGQGAASSGSFAGGLGVGAFSRWTGGLLGSGAGGGSSSAGVKGDGQESNANSAMHGLGVDARKYVESLLSLNR